jgi:hypothetical protein
MPKRISRPKRPSDINQLAHQLVQESTQESGPEPPISKSDISRVMAAMGRKGGQIGGKRRLETMTPEERREVAAKAAKARWIKKSGKKPSSKDAIQ